MNTVTKEEYWSIILNYPTQIGQITTEDTEFNRRINDVNLVLSNTFINSSDENLISKWETSLYIDGIEGKTITERKADILYTLCEKNYVPVSIIKRFLLNLIGDENKFVVEFVKDENKLVIHTDRISDDMNKAVTSLVESVKTQNIEVVQYNHNMEISWREVTVHVPPTEVNKYDHCTTVNEIAAVNPDYKNDLTSDGGWGYALFNLKSAGGLFDGDKSLKRFGLKVLPKVTSTNNMFRSSSIEELTLSLPKVNQFSSKYTDNANGFCAFASKLKRAEITIPLAEHQNEAFEGCGALETLILKETTSGIIIKTCKDCRKLFHFRTDAPEITQARLAFSNCRLDKDSALHVLRKLAPYTDDAEHLITMGIHTDYKADEEVLAAITEAENKGWTLTVQWNGTPTSTASTMAMGSLIYAKVGEIERPDGKAEQYIDWGHYVTDETGYETFRSLESAYKYFNLEQPTEI
jgi:hypothetical protein